MNRTAQSRYAKYLRRTFTVKAMEARQRDRLDGKLNKLLPVKSKLMIRI